MMPIPTPASAMRQTASKPFTANPQFHPGPKPRDMACNVALERTFTWEPDEFTVDHLVQAHEPAFCQQIVLCHDQYQAVGSKRVYLDGLGQGGFGGNSDIGRPRGDCLAYVGTLALFQVDIDRWVGLQE